MTPSIIVPITMKNEYANILDHKEVFLAFHKSTSKVRMKMIPAKYPGMRNGFQGPPRNPRAPNVTIPPQNAHTPPNNMITIESINLQKTQNHILVVRRSMPVEISTCNNKISQ